MATDQIIYNSVEYRIVLVDPDRRTVLVQGPAGDRSLPRVRVPECSRRTQGLRTAIHDAWDIPAFIVDFMGDDTLAPCVIAEIGNGNHAAGLSAVSLCQIPESELSQQERANIDLLLNDQAKGSVCRIGWIEDAIAWVESVTGQRVQLNTGVDQFNAGGGFALLRFHVEDGQAFWLKATGEPHRHEFATTALLSELAGEYLPEIVASKPEWNAWLMSGNGITVEGLPADSFELFSLLEQIVLSMAELQIRTIDQAQDLHQAGAFDQSVKVLATHSRQLFNSLEEAMDRQTSTRVPVIGKARVAEIRTIFDETCGRMEELDLPETVIHGDLGIGNLLMRGQECRFIDWSETYVGNPLVALQHILLFNQAEPPELRAFMNRMLTDRYRRVFERVCDRASIDEALIYMPLLAAASALYGRGDWIGSSSLTPRRSHTYARSLARHMDRAASDPILLKALSAKPRIGTRVRSLTARESAIPITK